LSVKENWVDVATVPGPVTDDDGSAETEVPPPPPPPAALSLLERDLQKFLSRNLEVIEKGLRPDPAYQLEEYPIDVGRIDLLCKDSRDNWVVIELKADWAGDDAVGQILGYMSWVKGHLPSGASVRGIIVCKNTTGRVKAAITWVPSLSVKRFALNFSIEDLG
jgi:RecB family endonuclease NucS